MEETTKKLSATLTDEENEEYSQKAEQLAKQYNVSKVHVVAQINPKTFQRFVCYLKEPNYVTKIRVMDKATTLGPFAAADELREACVIKEHSDSITYGESDECSPYKIGILDECLLMVNRYTNQFKKK